MLSNKKFAEVVFRDAPIKILNTLYLNENINISDIAKKSDVTYSHVIKFIRRLEANNYVKIERKGRVCLVSPTAKCKKMLETIKSLS